MHTLWYYLGLTDASGWPYLLWSGVVGDLGLLGAGWVIYRRHNCHQPRCWRVGRIETDGRLHCHRHHGSNT